MMIFTVILALGSLLWSINARFEWNMSPGCQTTIKSWQKSLSRKSSRIGCEWDTWPPEEDLERAFWHLKNELIRVGEKIKAPFWIEVQIAQNSDEKRSDKYLSCLQRRFPELEVTLGTPCREEHST